MPGLEPERAPVIVAGAVIVREVLARYGLTELEASDHDILHGAALAAAELPAEEEGAAPPGAYTLLMRYGLVLSNIGSFSKPANVVELAEQAEAAGWEALFLWDHLAWVWDGPAVDPWVTLGGVAARTGACCSAPA